MNIFGCWYILFMSLQTTDICKTVDFYPQITDGCIYVRFKGKNRNPYFLDYRGCQTFQNTFLLDNNSTMNFIDLQDEKRIMLKIDNQMFFLSKDNQEVGLYSVDQRNCTFF